MQMPFCPAMATLILALSACEQQTVGHTPATAEGVDLETLKGRWKADITAIRLEPRPAEFVLQGTTYICKSCKPALIVQANGQFQRVADQPKFDSIAVQVVDDRTVVIRVRRGQRRVSSVVMQVSGDGNVLNSRFRNTSKLNAAPVQGTETARRTGPAPAGAHAVSGRWTPGSRSGLY